MSIKDDEMTPNRDAFQRSFFSWDMYEGGKKELNFGYY